MMKSFRIILSMFIFFLLANKIITAQTKSTPNCAIIVYPLDGAIGVSINDSLSWNSVSDTTGYFLWFGTDGGGVTNPTSIADSLEMGLDTTYHFTNLEYNTTYYWKIVSYNNDSLAVGCEINEFTTELYPNEPGCVIPIFPPDSSLSVPVNDTLRWSSAAYADGYKVYFGTDGDGITDPTNILNGFDAGADTFTVFTNLDYSTVHYWKVVPYNVNGDAVDCEIWEFKTERDPNLPTCIIPVKPLDMATGVDIADSLVWNSIINADGYILWFGTDGGGIVNPTSIADSVDLGTDTTYDYSNLKNLPYNTKYYWKVLPYNSFGTPVECEILEFTTMSDPNPPGCTIPAEPLDFADSVAVSGILSWNTVFGATGYKLWFWTDGGGLYDPDTIANGNDLGNNSTFGYNNLYRGIVYNWKIVPYNSNGDAIGCPTWQFTTMPDTIPPPCIDPIAPLDMATNVNVQGSLIWTKSIGARGYRLWFGSDGGGTSNPTNLVEGQDLGLNRSYNYSSLNLDYSTKYFWKVVPYNDLGNPDTCSIFEFTTMPNPFPPDCVTPITPPIGDDSYGIIGKLRWNQDPIATGYRIWFGSDGGGTANPTNILNGFDVGNTQEYSFGPLDYGTIYYWKVVPYNGNGSADGCPIWNFETLTKIRVVSPNGGEVLKVDSTFTIRWALNQEKGLDNVEILYTTNQGDTWQTITNSFPAVTREYNWTVPNTASTKCRLRIKDPANQHVSDVSDSLFTIIGDKALLFQQPSTGDTLFIGDEYEIKWVSNRVDLVRIEYLLIGNTWIEIADSIDAEVGSYSWLVPNTPSLNARMRIVEIDGDERDEVQNLVIKPQLKIVHPAPGDTVRSGLPYDITWESGGINRIRILFSSNGGNSWSTVVTDYSASNEFFTWQVPGINSDSCKFYIRDENDEFLFFETGLFVIKYIPTINVLSPEEGEIIEGNTVYPISWQTVGVEQLNIAYSTNAGGDWADLATSVLSQVESYNWLVPNIASDSTKIRIRDANNPQLFGETGLFTIDPATDVKDPSQDEAIPSEYKLYTNYPNPFNPSTRIKYSIPEEAFVTIKVFDILGAEVATLVNETRSPGNYELNFDASNLRSGVYLYRIQAGNYTESRKMLFIK
ncbi:MAG: T9SS type A sorting domain-containing protein [Melioribacteraceae bacterium]|nr:T9SS type A sorting domain-containing protein [Melioribacteraceae bacterium]